MYLLIFSWASLFGSARSLYFSACGMFKKIIAHWRSFEKLTRKFNYDHIISKIWFLKYSLPNSTSSHDYDFFGKGVRREIFLLLIEMLSQACEKAGYEKQWIRREKEEKRERNHTFFGLSFLSFLDFLIFCFN